MKAKTIVALMLVICLALGAAACTASSAAEAVDAAPQQAQAPAEETASPETEISTQEAAGAAPTSAGADEVQEAEGLAEESDNVCPVTDEELLDLVLGPELALTGQNEFTFQDPTELSSQELYMLFLYFSDYETLVKDCEDKGSGEFTFTKEYISAVLSKYFNQI